MHGVYHILSRHHRHHRHHAFNLHSCNMMKYLGGMGWRGWGLLQKPDKNEKQEKLLTGANKTKIVSSHPSICDTSFNQKSPQPPEESVWIVTNRRTSQLNDWIGQVGWLSEKKKNNMFEGWDYSLLVLYVYGLFVLDNSKIFTPFLSPGLRITDQQIRLIT